MSKELSPLEAWERANNNTYEHGYEISGDLCYIIETALKDYERLLKLRKTAKWADEKLQTKKKLKALEIIKELFKEMGLRFIFSSDNIVLIVDNSEFEYWHKCKTQEEYDLLKEVLL